MDIYDPQTIGVIVFGGFMVISAIAIVLVSTFSMKETSYEEALAKQRKEQEKTQPKLLKKKKDKLPEKKAKSKKKDDRPNGKLPEYEPPVETKEEKKVVLEPQVVVEVVKAPVKATLPVTPVVAPAPEKAVNPPKKVAAPAPEKAVNPAKKAPAPEKAVNPPKKVAAPAPEKAVNPPKKVAAPEKVVNPPKKVVAAAPEKAPSNPPKKVVAPAPEKAVAPVAPVVATAPEKAAPSPKDKKKKEKKVQKVEPSQAQVVTVTKAVSKSPPVLEVPAKEVPVVAVPPVGAKPSQKVVSPVARKSSSKPNAQVTANNTQAQPPKKSEPVTSQENHKQEPAPKKKNAQKKKSEPVSNDLDGALYLPYKTLVSTISSMVLSEGEALKLIEILTERNGIKQDTWHTATQKGDPVAALRKQLEEKERLLSAEHENAAAAKNKLRDITKELAAEKTKVNNVEAKLKEQILSRDQENNALQARMQASYKDHLVEIQKLQGKIRGLQDELENGPKAQLARLQQENSILRDALNQATSQTESKQNTELAKLRQECNKLSKELTEKSEALQQEEQKRKSVDGKISVYEKQVAQLQALQKESEATLQKRLDEVSEELRKSQNSYKTLLADTDKAKAEQKNVADLQTKLMSYEAEGKQKSEELDRLNQRLQGVTGENTQLLERIKSIEALLEAGQSKVDGMEQQDNKEAELKQLHERLQEKETQLSLLEKEAVELKDTIEQQKNKNNELREKNWQAMDALGKVEKTCEEKLSSERKSKDDLEKQLGHLQSQSKETLMKLFPQVSVESHQLYSEWLQEFREKSSDVLKQLSQQSDQTDSSALSVKLKEAEEAQASLQAECEQYRTILAETEGMLKDLQKSVEEEEQVWKVKLEASEEELKKSQVKIKTLEETVERLKLDVQSTDQLKECIALMEAQLETQMNTSSSECQTYSKEVECLRQLLSESQEQLESTKAEARKQSKELSLLRQQLSEMQNHVHDSHGSEVNQLKAPQSSIDDQNEDQNISKELEEKSMYSLQQELEKLKTVEDSSSGTEEAQQLKERLDKEKKLTRDLGQAANKMLQLLKASQEQLTKEKEHNKLLQNRLQLTVLTPSSFLLSVSY
ncbi:hypothetical protein GDO81_008539 [Engystomops pustulosus]|uniref:Ribosome receptor lysine/proline rich domain-containing protein n=1 Tax=Engystomops pustulosus TaxID=76066 RepID=A0AAV7CFJ9_ENGPU|nr:hypothetical protein GDO81_008539 [Engystomops pustulosus]